MATHRTPGTVSAQNWPAPTNPESRFIRIFANGSYPIFQEVDARNWPDDDPSKYVRPEGEVEANFAFAVTAWNNHDRLIDTIRSVIAANGDATSISAARKVLREIDENA